MSKPVVGNFGKVTASTTYDAAAVSIVLTTGHGAKLPSTFPFYLVWWDVTTYPDPADDPNVEIVKVTARSTDTLTVTRAQDGTSASTKNTAAKTYRMMLAPVKAIHDDIYNMMREIGCGRFNWISTTVCTFSPYRGNVVCINGQNETIPSAGVAFSNSGLLSNTVYYAYVYMVAGVMTGEFSVTGHATDSSSGQEIKSGDSSRSLVGMIATDSAAHFNSSNTFRGTLSWFNRRPLDMRNFFSTDRGTSSNSFVELNSEIRIQWITWANEGVYLAVSGAVANTTASSLMDTSIGVDSTTVQEATWCSTQAFANGARGGFACSLCQNYSEGVSHYATLLGAVSGTGTWTGGTNRTNIMGMVRG